MLPVGGRDLSVVASATNRKTENVLGGTTDGHGHSILFFCVSQSKSCIKHFSFTYFSLQDALL